MPLKPGQRMLVTESGPAGVIGWETFVTGQPWFSATFNLEERTVMQSSDPGTAAFILKLLDAGASLQPGLLSARSGYHVRSELEFDIRWGLGSSSSLISNLAFWLDVDPYALFRMVMPGSGYDVFCARSEVPILYRLEGMLPVVESAGFHPAFSDKLYFIYLGNKQDSQDSVRKFKQDYHPDPIALEAVSRLTVKMAGSPDLADFMQHMAHHEQILSRVLECPTIKSTRFDDFDGEIKSLGAWGGDFVLAASFMPENSARDYFTGKNHDIVFRYDELVHQS